MDRQSHRDSMAIVSAIGVALSGKIPAIWLESLGLSHEDAERLASNAKVPKFHNH